MNHFLYVDSYRRGNNKNLWGYVGQIKRVLN
jgi:hypothetical protein